MNRLTNSLNDVLTTSKKRSDPILSSYFVGQLKAEQIFELDAVSHEMQRHRMSIGIFTNSSFWNCSKIVGQVRPLGVTMKAI